MDLGSLSPTVSGLCGKDPPSPTLTWRQFQMPSQKGVQNRLYSTDAYQCIGLVWPTRLVFLAMGEVLSFGFNLAVSSPSDSRGREAHIILFPSRKRWGLHH